MDKCYKCGKVIEYKEIYCDKCKKEKCFKCGCILNGKFFKKSKDNPVYCEDCYKLIMKIYDK